MIRREVKAELYRLQAAPVDIYKEHNNHYEYVEDIAVIISYKSANHAFANEVEANTYIITGLTTNKTVKPTDKIINNSKAYYVDTIVETGKKRILHLREETNG